MAHPPTQAPPAPTLLKLASLEGSNGLSMHGQIGDYDALADLFLGPSAQRRPPAGSAESRSSPAESPGAKPAAPAAEPRRKFHLEGLILGHLPVMASAWGMQYARQIAAERDEPVGILRVRGEEASVELVGAEAMEEAEDLNEALRRAVARAHYWLVRVDGPRESMLAEHRELDVVTLLSGADQAATVAAYGTIKQLFPPGKDADSGNGDAALAHAAEDGAPRVRIVIVGSPDGRAASARLTLARAAEAFLARGVEVAAGPHRIGGGGPPTVRLFRGSAPEAEEILRGLRTRLARADGERGPAPAAAPASPASRTELDRHLVRVMEEAVAAAPGRDALRAGSTPGPAPEPQAVEVPRDEGIAPVDAPLSGHLGFTPLAARCPFAPGVELAADDQGDLHLLLQLSEAESVRSLLAVAAWATSHAQLLRLASPAMNGSPRPPVLHLFVADARLARDLYDTGVRLHLLAAVEVGGQAGWFCAALN